MSEIQRACRGDRPFVHLNAALHPNGSVSGQVSCAADLRRVHELRERLDAVAVGGVTWRTDLPRLSVREERLGRPPLRQPARIVFSGQPVEDHHDLATPFVVVRPGPTLPEQLTDLGRRNIHSLLLEGGPQLWAAFLRAGVVDEVTVYVRTQSLATALIAAATALPGLPIPLHHALLGEGLLLSDQPRLRRSVSQRQLSR